MSGATPAQTIPNSSPPGEFFKHGVPMSIILLMVLGLAMMTLWPMLDMPNLVNK